MSNVVIAFYAPRCDPGDAQSRIQKVPASRSFFPVHDSHILTMEVSQGGDVLGIAVLHDQPLLPNGKRGHANGPRRKSALDQRDIVSAGRMVQKMRSGGMHAALL